MTDLATLVVKLEAQTAQYQASLDQANRRLDNFASSQKTSLAQITSGFDRVKASAREFSSFLNLLRGAGAIGGLAIAARQLESFAESIAAVDPKAAVFVEHYTRLQNALKTPLRFLVDKAGDALSWLDQMIAKLEAWYDLQVKLGRIKPAQPLTPEQGYALTHSGSMEGYKPPVEQPFIVPPINPKPLLEGMGGYSYEDQEKRNEALFQQYADFVNQVQDDIDKRKLEAEQHLQDQLAAIRRARIQEDVDAEMRGINYIYEQQKALANQEIELMKQMEDAQKPAQDAAIANMKRLQEEVKQFADTFANALVENWKGGLKEMVEELGKTLLIMAAKIQAANLFEGIAKSAAGSASWYGKAFTAIFGGARASGGPVSMGMSYLVGERGPELFTPNVGGVISASAAGGINLSIPQTFIVGDVATKADVAQAAQAAARRAVAEAKDLNRRGRL